MEPRRWPSALRSTNVALVVAALVLDLLIWGFDGRTRAGFTVPDGVVVGSAIAAFAVLLVRHRRPWVAFLCLWSYTVLWGALLPTYQPFTGLLIALYHLARHPQQRTARQPLLLLVVPWVINTYNAVVATGVRPLDTAVTAAIWCAMAAGVWLAGRAGHRTQHIFELERANQAAEAALALQQQQLRLARELHDIIAHSVNAVMFQAAGARAIGNSLSPQLQHSLHAIESSSTQAMRELRRLLGLLQPEAKADAVEAVASLNDLDQLLDTTRACGIDIRVTVEGRPTPLDPSVDHTAYRVLQEALANTMKHGGRGARADVDLQWSTDRLRITVRDQPGLDAPRSTPGTTSTGYGLRGLRQRVTGIGGQLNTGPAGGGFLVIADLPLNHTPPPA